MKKIIISSLFIIAATSALANDVRIAFSKTENIEIFARNPDANGQWCTDDIEVNLSSVDPAIDYNSPAVDQMIFKVGEAVIAKSCETAQRLTVYRGDNNLLLGVALKDSNWAMIRDGANEEDEPTGEGDKEDEPTGEGDKEDEPTGEGNVPDKSNGANFADSPLIEKPEYAQQEAIAYPNIREEYVAGKVKEAFDSHKKDMPLTAEKVDKLSALFQGRSNSHQSPVGADPKLEFVKLLKASIEKDMGYDFDLSFRRAAVFEDLSVYTNAGKAFQNVYSYYINFTQDTMNSVIKEGIFSQETFDVIRAALYRVNNDQDISFINMAIKCQSKHGGKFTGTQLVDCYKEEKIIPADQNNDALYSSYMGGGLEHASDKIWISDESGGHINANFILRDKVTNIVVNRKNIEEALHGALIYEEQKEFFNRLQKMYEGSDSNGNSHTVNNNADKSLGNTLNNSVSDSSTTEKNAESKSVGNASNSVLHKIYNYALIILRKFMSLFITYPSEIVQEGHFDLDRSLSVGNALDHYKYFKKTFWLDGKDEQGRKIVTFIGKTNFDAYLGHVDPTSHWEVSQLAVTKAKAIGDNDAIAQVIVIVFSVNDDNTFQAVSAHLGNMKKNDVPQYEGDVLAYNVNDILGIIYRNEPNPLTVLMLWGAEKSQK